MVLETGGRMVVAGAGGENEALLFNGHRVWVWGDEGHSSASV